uniref:Uncharacterized protein n=1 Tax=Arundo donax TaxID=35708 RepID=A0A0A9ATE8_ARUDO
MKGRLVQQQCSLCCPCYLYTFNIVMMGLQVNDVGLSDMYFYFSWCKICS